LDLSQLKQHVFKQNQPGATQLKFG